MRVNFVFNPRYIKINTIDMRSRNQYLLSIKLVKQGFSKNLRCKRLMYKLSPYLCNVPLYKLNINLKETISGEQKLFTCTASKMTPQDLLY